jgi:uncharacterized low-complexity protein
MLKQNKSKLSIITIAALLFAVIGFTTIANSATSPFAQNDATATAKIIKDDAGKCGEGKCGDSKSEETEEAVTEETEEAATEEKKCGDDKAEKKCGDDKATEEKKDKKKCGEGKCG